jgi:hypothetical protein
VLHFSNARHCQPLPLSFNLIFGGKAWKISPGKGSTLLSKIRLERKWLIVIKILTYYSIIDTHTFMQGILKGKVSLYH